MYVCMHVCISVYVRMKGMGRTLSVLTTLRTIQEASKLSVVVAVLVPVAGSWGKG